MCSKVQGFVHVHFSNDRIQSFRKSFRSFCNTLQVSNYDLSGRAVMWLEIIRFHLKGISYGYCGRDPYIEFGKFCWEGGEGWEEVRVNI